MVELSQVVTIVLAFTGDVTSHFLASWIYERLIASSGRAITIRFTGSVVGAANFSGDRI